MQMMEKKIPMIRSGSLQGFDKQVLKFSGNPVYLLQAAGLSPAVLRDPELMIPYAAVAEVLEISAKACQLETFGLEMGEKQGLPALGPLGLIAAQQPSLKDALSLTSKYAHLHADGADINLVSNSDGLFIVFNLNLPQAAHLEQLVQLSLGLIHRVIQTMAGPAWRAKKIWLKQGKPKKGLHELTQKLNCPIEFEQGLNGIGLSAQDLNIKPQPDEQLLKQHFQGYLCDLELKYPNQLLAKIRHCIRSLLPTGECSLPNVAITLGIHPRVLQKQLKSLASSFSKLLRETRYEMACDLLRSSTMPVTDIALHLGFAELSVFSRSFKTWSNCSPNKWRQAYRQ
jgi:AraC-like DNA-binding protein